MVRWLTWCCLAALAAMLCGCQSTGQDRLSTRPWNTPQDWESGFPGGMMPQQGR